MTKHLYLAPLAGLPLAALVAWRLGGSVGAGALLGVLAATALSVAGLAWSSWALAARPKQVLTAFVASFLAKLAVLAGGAVWLRYGASAAQRFDWTAYLLGFAAAVLLAMALASSLQFAAGRPSKESHAS